MNKRKSLKKQLRKGYRYKKFMSVIEVKNLLNSTSKDCHEKIYASLTVGCVKINAVLFPTPNGMTSGCDIFVKDRPDSEEWICYDMISEPFRYSALNLEQELFETLDKAVREHKLSYTDCNFEKLNGKTVSKI
jgi:hypothetical protein